MWTIMTVLSYLLVTQLSKKVKLPLFNSVLYATGLLVSILLLMHVEYDTYKESSALIANSLEPFVIFLAVPLYKYRHKLVSNIKVIMAGMLTSSLISLSTIALLSKFLKIDLRIIKTLIPKSITTPMALSMTKMIGGIPSVTVISVIITGISGATIMPYILRIVKINNPIAIGVALGSTSHGIGTSKALEFSEEAGAISGLAMGLTGSIYIILTSLILVFEPSL